MKIVDRKTFLGMPRGTVFAKFEPTVFGELCIKGKTLPDSGDFLYQELADSIMAHSSDEAASLLDDAQEKGTSVAFDFYCESRDGCFDENQLFSVWGDGDVCQLITRLMAARTVAGVGVA